MLNRKDRNKPVEAVAPPALRENTEVNRKIDQYIKDNPQHWEYVKNLPPERMARALVLASVRQQEQRSRMEQAIKDKIDQNPELKANLEQLVAKLPEDQRERARIRMGGEALRALKPQQNSQGVGVRM